MNTKHLKPAVCIGCGCDDLCACVGGCSWVRVDRTRRLGVCSQCTELLEVWRDKFEGSEELQTFDVVRLGVASVAPCRLRRSGRLKVAGKAIKAVAQRLPYIHLLQSALRIRSEDVGALVLCAWFVDQEEPYYFSGDENLWLNGRANCQWFHEAFSIFRSEDEAMATAALYRSPRLRALATNVVTFTERQIALVPEKILKLDVRSVTAVGSTRASRAGVFSVVA